MCPQEVVNQGPLTPTWQSRGRVPRPFSTPLLKHEPLERRQQPPTPNIPTRKEVQQNSSEGRS